jgi:DNA-binding CsgD family transcriptional regulator/tetratricopeptide (TPR) repeat protein
MSAAERLLDGVSAGIGGCLVVTAPAGAGKTRLLDAIADAARARSIDVRSATAHSGTVAPFSLATSAFGRPAGVSPTPDRGSLFEAGIVASADNWMLEHLIDIVDDLALSRPVVAIFDDVHLADPGSIAFVQVLHEQLATTPLALVIGSRSPDPDHGVGRWWPALCATAQVLELQPLSEDALRALCVARLGAPPGPRLARSLGATGGLPLLATTTLDAVADAGADVDSSRAEIDATVERLVLDAVPDPVRSRLDAVVGADVVVVAAAAISGATFDAAEVAAVVQAPLIEVISVVTRLERAGVVAATEQVHRFRHEHFRRSAEQLVSAPIRAALHRAYVDFFTARGESPLLIVDHVLASGSTGTVAAAWLQRAAELLMRSDPKAAASLTARAIEIDPEPDRALLRLRCRALSGMGQVAESDELVRLLLVDAEPEEEIVLRREVAVGLFREGRPNESIIELQRAAALEPDLAGRRRLLAEQAFMHLLAGEFEPARLAARAAADEVRRLGDARPERDTVTQLAAEMVGGLVALYHLDLDDATAIAERLELLAELPSASGAALYQPWFSASIIRLELGEFARAKRINNVGRVRSVDAGYFWAVPGYDTLDAAIHFQQGSFDDAEAAAGAALATGITDAYGARLWSAALLARCAAVRGEWASARERLEVARALVRPTQAQLGTDHLVMAEAAVLEHDEGVAAALALAGAAWDVFEAWQIDMPRQELSLEVVRLAALAGDRERVAQVVSHLERVAQVTGRERFVLDHECARWSAADPSARGGTEDERVRLRDAYGRLGHDLRLLRLERPDRRGPASESRSVAGALTKSERTVALLLAEGLTNAQIADRLFISRRTVESHVSATYRKLGVDNRVELARRVAGFDRPVD